MHCVSALLCYVVVWYWLIHPHYLWLLHLRDLCNPQMRNIGKWMNHMIASYDAKMRNIGKWIGHMTDSILTWGIFRDGLEISKQNTPKSCAYCMGYTIYEKWKYMLMFKIWECNICQHRMSLNLIRLWFWFKHFCFHKLIYLLLVISNSYFS